MPNQLTKEETLNQIQIMAEKLHSQCIERKSFISCKNSQIKMMVLKTVNREWKCPAKNYHYT